MIKPFDLSKFFDFFAKASPLGFSKKSSYKISKLLPDIMIENEKI